MKNKKYSVILAITILLIVFMMAGRIRAGSYWGGAGYDEDTSADGTEKVFVEDGDGTGNAYMSLDTIKTYFDSYFEGELNNSEGLALAIGDGTGSGANVFSENPSLSGKVRFIGTTDDDDCTGDQGRMWWDNTDSRFEFCNANSGVPMVIGSYTSDTVYGVGWDSVTTDSPSKNAIYDYMVHFDADADGDFTDEAWFPSGNIDDTAYSAAWNGDVNNGPTKNAIYDYLALIDADADGSLTDEAWWTSAGVENDIYGAGWNGDTSNSPSQNAVYDYLVQFDADADGDFTDEAWFPSGNVEDAVYGAGWNGDILNAPTQNAIYDYLVNFDADSDGSFTDEAWLYAKISDVAFAAGWNGDTTNAPSKNAIHDYLINFDADLDGSFTDEAWFASMSVENDVYGVGWNGDTANAPSQNAIYDYLVNFDADSDGSFTDETWLYARISDAIFGAAWNGDSTNSASKNAIHDYIVKFDADLDGSFTDEAWYPSVTLEDTAWGPTWNADTGGATKNAIYDMFVILDTDADGSLADEDVTFKTVSVAPSAVPGITFEDVDLLGADDYAGSIEMNCTTLTDGGEICDQNFYYQDGGTKTLGFTIDGSDNRVEFQVGTTFQNNDIISAEIATIIESISWTAAGTSSDGTQCADPTEVTINSGPKIWATICADNDASTIYGMTPMPDSWDGGTVTFESQYIQTAADTNAVDGDISCQCRGSGEVVNSTWGTEVAITNAGVNGSNANNHTTSGAVTCAGTCAGGDTLYWRYQLDATGTTTAAASLNFIGWKMEYTSNVGD